MGKNQDKFVMNRNGKVATYNAETLQIPILSCF